MKRIFKNLVLIGTMLSAVSFVAYQASAQMDTARTAALLQASAPTSPAGSVNPAAVGQSREIPIAPPVNIADEVQDFCNPVPFGESLFAGGAQKSPQLISSSKQRVAYGDRVTVAIWGAVQAEQTEVVDSQGFIYLKGVGPVHVQGKSEDELSKTIRAQIQTVFKDDVQVYARLEQNAGTPVLVTGAVNKPGQYAGSAADSIIVWLQRAGGIAAEQGSYRDIKIMRDGKEIKRVDLYPFLISGTLETVDWVAGDVIVVGPVGKQVATNGDVRRCAVFELPKDMQSTGATLTEMAQPTPGATHAVVAGYRGGQPFSRVHSLAGFAAAELQDGDRVKYYGAPRSEQITVNIEGPTKGNRILVLPIHTRLSEALDMIPVNEKVSNTSAVFIRRQKVAEQQQRALDESIHRLLQSAMTAPASSDGEALIRAKEAELIQGFAMSARTVKQEGRVVVMRDGVMRDLPLEDNDTIVIPEKTDVVTIEGEVMLPRAVVVDAKASADDYVKMAGGFTERAVKNEFIVIHPNGDAERAASPKVAAGDRLLVMPKVDTKTMQTTKDLVQILYQIAVGAGVLLSIDN